MNKLNVIYTESDGMLHAEWSDRALDDDDRYAEDSIFIRVSVPAEQGPKALNMALHKAYDEWMEERT